MPESGVSRILFPLRGDGHSSGRTVARPLLQPTREIVKRATSCLLYSVLLRAGFAEPPKSPTALVRSYRTVSPLPAAGTQVPRSVARTELPGGRSALCCTFRRVSAPGR